MKYTPEEIKARKANSLAKFQMYRQREMDIKAGRRFFIENKLPLLVAFPSDEVDFGIYITFFPTRNEGDELRVAFAVRSRRDADSPRKVRGILGHRFSTNDPETTILLKASQINHCTLKAKDGGWSFMKLYAVFGFVVLDEIKRWSRAPKWMQRRIRDLPILSFKDYRLTQNSVADWPEDALRIVERYYEQQWPKPPMSDHA
jgi:hypothetical protein